MNIMDIDGNKAAIAYDPDINLFRGEFIELNSGADFYGADVETLRKEGETSLRIYLKMCQEQGIEPRCTISGQSNMRIQPELNAKRAQEAAAELFRPYWGRPDIDIQEPVDCPPQPTSIADEMDSMHEANRACPL
ncbi:MAG: type II toxin-antitoxin system HicB family antitoxin [Hydrogenophilales bacterium]|nr:type II toxin-antitoxin system HicB family antitoxin [Hydrogenophilales bacterium]